MTENPNFITEANEYLDTVHSHIALCRSLSPTSAEEMITSLANHERELLLSSRIEEKSHWSVKYLWLSIKRRLVNSSDSGSTQALLVSLLFKLSEIIPEYVFSVEQQIKNGAKNTRSETAILDEATQKLFEEKINDSCIDCLLSVINKDKKNITQSDIYNQFLADFLVNTATKEFELLALLNKIEEIEGKITADRNTYAVDGQHEETLRNILEGIVSTPFTTDTSLSCSRDLKDFFRNNSHTLSEQTGDELAQAFQSSQLLKPNDPEVNHSALGRYHYHGKDFIAVDLPLEHGKKETRLIVDNASILSTVSGQGLTREQRALNFPAYKIVVLSSPTTQESVRLDVNQLIFSSHSRTNLKTYLTDILPKLNTQFSNIIGAIDFSFTAHPYLKLPYSQELLQYIEKYKRYLTDNDDTNFLYGGKKKTRRLKLLVHLEESIHLTNNHLARIAHVIQAELKQYQVSLEQNPSDKNQPISKVASLEQSFISEPFEQTNINRLNKAYNKLKLMTDSIEHHKEMPVFTPEEKEQLDFERLFTLLLLHKILVERKSISKEHEEYLCSHGFTPSIIDSAHTKQEGNDELTKALKKNNLTLADIKAFEPKALKLRKHIFSQITKRHEAYKDAITKNRELSLRYIKQIERNQPHFYEKTLLMLMRELLSSIHNFALKSVCCFFHHRQENTEPTSLKDKAFVASGKKAVELSA